MASWGIASLEESFSSLKGQRSRIRSLASNAKATLASRPVTSDEIFALLDNIRTLILGLDSIPNIAGLNTYATAQMPGYTGVLADDVASTRAALVACITLVVGIFPSAGGWLQSHQLAADGIRIPRSFTSIQTVGLQTALQGVLDTIA